MKVTSETRIFASHLTAPPSRFREFLGNLRAVLGRPPKLFLTSQPLPIPYADLGRGALPGRGILYSSVVHEIILALIFVVPALLPPTVPETRREYEARWLDTKLTYSLPPLGGGREGGDRPGGKSGGGAGRTERRASAPPEGSRGASGLVYPAPQPAVSNPPLPTNRIQTILQPELPNPPELKVPVPLPNLVQLRRPKTPAPPALIPKVEIPPVERVPPPEAPQLQAHLQPQRVPLTMRATPPPPLPTEPRLEFPVAPVEVISVPLPPPPKTEVKPVIPQLSRFEPQPMPEAPSLDAPAGAVGTDERTLLALSPVPGPPEERPQVAEGEARGRFAMGPEANLNGDPDGPPGMGTTGAQAGTGQGTGISPVGTGPGSERGGEGSGGVGSGSGTAGVGEGEGGGSAPGSGGGGGGGTGPGIGTRAGAGVGSGPGGTGTGVGTGTGGGIGPGRGSGTGTGTGTGSGAGAGPGSGPFPGISVQGGSGTGLAGPAPGGRPDSGPRPNYGMTVSSTAASGGGLRDYGIFHNESVFTVYIEMTHSPTRAPSWILQYAQLRQPTPGGTPAAGSLRLGDHVVAPYPVTKEHAEFPNDLVARNLGKLVVVYGEINVKGKVENTRIIQSPNSLLNRPALEALKKWEFRPAESNGRPVPVKILVGIPLSIPPA